MSALAASSSVLGMLVGAIAAASAAKLFGSRVVPTDTSMPLRANALARAWHVTEWRMQKAMQLLQQRDKKRIDVARSVGYESDAAFSKAFKRVVGANPGEYLKRGF